MLPLDVKQKKSIAKTQKIQPLLMEVQKKYANGVPVFNSIQTNGGLIDDEWAAFFKENRFLVGLSRR